MKLPSFGDLSVFEAAVLLLLGITITIRHYLEVR